MMKKVFISYSWDSEEHQLWVVELANKLRECGIDANIDLFIIHQETTNLNKMMVKEIRESDHVIVVLTREYKDKVDNWQGGVSFESDLLLPSLIGESADKLIFIMKHNGDYKTVFPFQYNGYYAIDFTDSSKSSMRFKELLHRIKGEPLYMKKDIGVMPKLLPLNSEGSLINNVTRNVDTLTDVIKVANVSELIKNIGPNKKIHLTQGIYNLSNASEVHNDYIEWVDEYDGDYPVIIGVDNLTITADIATQIVIEPRYAFVFEFKDCDNISILNVTLGHTESGYCIGGVLGFKKCSNVLIENSVLFGCGTLGLELSEVKRMKFVNSTIKECTYSLMHISSSEDVVFYNSVFKETGEFDLIEVNKSVGVEMNNCIIAYNKTSEYQPHLFKVDDVSDDVLIENTEIKYNEIKKMSNKPNKLKFIDCKFHGNDFSSN
ncbi:SEFIR domain-containing protein [Aeromonas veronii]|uniref:SEFIR domain-containing protein n=1 Tax=Aeromonas veronii TaxID=654 RepID=UPI001BCBDAE3|nr:SEFIR domain-containing protein [Aeromonas veronii]MBS4703446.1 TIR domain-containing protein [Aeromonas veronii]